MSRRMMVISDLDVWLLTAGNTKPGAGNQDMYNTLLGYARAGWDVHLLTTQCGLAGMPPIHPHVTVHRRPIRLVEAQQAAKKLLKKVVRRLRRNTAEGGAAAAGSPRPKRMALSPWYGMAFRRVMGRRAVALARRLGGADLVYGYETYGVLAGRAAADALGVPLVTRFQGTELCRYLADPPALLACKGYVDALRIPADLVIMANDGTQGDKVLDLVGVPKERYRFWMNGVVKDDVYRPNVDAAGIRRRLGIADGDVFVLHTGRMFHWKRIDRHLRVIERAAREFPHFKAVFIGDGPERQAVEALAGALRLEGRVIFLGAMPHDEVMNYLNACDIYIAFQDLSNLSNAPIECCVCGKCIVTTAVGGTTDLLTDGASAVVVPQHDDVEAIAAGLLRVLKDPRERARLAEGARRRGQELKSWEERMRMETDEVERLLAPRVQT
jgi:glycosyltransferase involved in cell wall biosynthesis